jgi:hypothetical protein
MAPTKKKGKVSPRTSWDDLHVVGEVTTGDPLVVLLPEQTRDLERVDLEDQHQDNDEDPKGTGENPTKAQNDHPPAQEDDEMSPEVREVLREENEVEKLEERTQRACQVVEQ